MEIAAVFSGGTVTVSCCLMNNHGTKGERAKEIRSNASEAARAKRKEERAARRMEERAEKLRIRAKRKEARAKRQEVAKEVLVKLEKERVEIMKNADEADVALDLAKRTLWSEQKAWADLVQSGDTSAANAHNEQVKIAQHHLKLATDIAEIRNQQAIEAGVRQPPVEPNRNKTNRNKSSGMSKTIKHAGKRASKMIKELDT